jgi:TfoX/Sxy family transcriptional regulator of competence genes
MAGLTERRMFGGVCFGLNGHMLCGVVKDEIMVRIGPEAYARALRKPHAREMDFTGRAMIGYVYVAEPGFRSDVSLQAWLELACQFVHTLPAKAAAPHLIKPRPRKGARPKRSKAAGWSST